jgi:hypothetical protein
LLPDAGTARGGADFSLKSKRSITALL